MNPNSTLLSYQLQRVRRLDIKTRKDWDAQIICRALKDEAFKQELLANPKALVEKQLGTIPEGIEINVLEETATTLYLVLPSNPYQGLAESELKAYLGMTYEDVARWVLEQQKNVLLDETGSVEIISRTWKDPAFKHELLSNPEMAISVALGVKIPPGIEIEVFEETANTLFLVLPRIFDDFGTSEDLPDSEWYFANGVAEPLLVMVGSGGELDCPGNTCSPGFVDTEANLPGFGPGPIA